MMADNIKSVPFTEQQLETSSTMMDEVKNLDLIEIVHNDEAVKVLASYSGDQNQEPLEEKTLVREVDRKLLPIMCITLAI